MVEVGLKVPVGRGVRLGTGVLVDKNFSGKVSWKKSCQKPGIRAKPAKSKAHKVALAPATPIVETRPIQGRSTRFGILHPKRAELHFQHFFRRG